MIINSNRHNFFRMFLTNDIFIKEFINLYNGSSRIRKDFIEVTFFGDGGGWRFFVLSSLIFVNPSFSDKTTKKWLHFSHLTNLVAANEGLINRFSKEL